MVGGSSVVENFLRESFLIETWKDYRLKIKRASDEEKYRIHIDLQLSNTFTLRMLKDPGFYAYVLSNVYKDENCVKKVKEFISNVWNDEKRVWPKGIAVDIPIDYRPLFMYHDHSQKNDVHVEPAKIYLSRRLEAAVNRGDDDEAFAISQLMKEYNTHKSYTHKLYGAPSIYECLENSLYDTIEYTDNWNYASFKYFINNLNHFALYHSESLTDKFFYVYAFRDPAFAFQFLEYMFNIYEETIDRSQYHELFAYYDKFVSDCLSIASLVWFEGKSAEEKKDMLNGQYPLTEQSPYNRPKEELTNIASKWFMAVDHYFNLLIQGCYSNEAIFVSECLMAICEDDIFRSNHYKKIADLLAQEYRFEEALSYYHKLYNMTLSNRLIKGINDPALLLITIGELHFHRGDQINGEKYIEEAREMACLNLSIEELSGLYHNTENLPIPDDALPIFKTVMIRDRLEILKAIVHVYRTIRDTKSEYKYLNEMMNIDKAGLLNNDSSFWNRLNELNNIDLKGYDYKLWKTKLNNGEFNYYFKKAAELYQSFQFKKGIVEMEHVLKYNNEVGALEDLSAICLDANVLDKADGYVENLLKKDEKHARGRLIRSLIRLRQGKIDDSIEDIKSSLFNSFYQKTDINLIIAYYLEELLKCKEISDPDVVLSKILDKETFNKDLTIIENTIADTYFYWGFYEYALPYYNKSKELVKEDEKRIDILKNMSIIYLSNGLEEKAISCYNECIKIKDLAEFYHGKAIIYTYMMKFNNALEQVEEALKRDPDNMEYKIKKNVLIELSQAVIELKLITDKPVRDSLFSADKLLLKLYKHLDGEYDFEWAGAFYYYGKGLEQMLHNQISLKIREEAMKKFPENFASTYINGNVKGNTYPATLNKILCKDPNDIQSITLGEWPRFNKDLYNYQNNKIVRYVKNIYENKLSNLHIRYDDTYYKIKRFRNDSDHLKSFTIEQVLLERNMMVHYINNVIEKLYS